MTLKSRNVWNDVNWCKIKRIHQYHKEIAQIWYTKTRCLLHNPQCLPRLALKQHRDEMWLHKCFGSMMEWKPSSYRIKIKNPASPAPICTEFNSELSAHKKSSVLVLTPKDMYHVLNFNVVHVHIEMSLTMLSRVIHNCVLASGYYS